MLICSRRCGAVIKIGGATITIKELTAGSVTLSIDAPAEIPIDVGTNPPRREFSKKCLPEKVGEQTT